MNISITSFNSGEMSPLLQARSDTAKHSSGLKRCENYIPRVSGAIIRRPGMRFLTAGRDETKKIVVVGLNFGVGDSCVLELGHNYMRVLDASTGLPVELATSVTYWDITGKTQVTITGLPTTHRVTPWAEQHLHELQFCQINDLVYVTHPAYPPTRITRFSATKWTVQAITYDWPAMADENVTDTTLALSGTTLTASADTFVAGHVGSYFELSHRRASQSSEAIIDSETPSTEDETCTFTTVDGKIRCNITAHGWPVNSKVKFTTTDALPAGVEAGKTYYVVGSGLATDSFYFAETEGGAPIKAALFEFTAATNDKLTVADHPYYAGQALKVSTDGTLPSPLLLADTYYARDVTSTTFKLALTAGGSAIDITDAGSGPHYITTVSAGAHTATRSLPYPLATPSDTTVTTTPLRIFGKASIFTFGAWAGVVKLHRVTGVGTSEIVQTWTGNGDRNLAVEIEQYPEAELFLEVVAHKVAPQVESETWGRDARFILEAADAVLTGLVYVTAVASPTSATVTVISPTLNTTATKQWSESAWSAKRGYPRAICLHQQRLCFAGTAYDPQTIWVSAIGDFQNFRRSTLDDGALAFSVATTENNSIQWVTSSSGGIIVGTSGDEWTITADGGIITATNVQIKRQSRYGSEYRQGLPVNEVVIFVQRGGRKLREHVFSFERDGYVAPDLTLLADHITRGGVRSMALMQQPDAIVWLARNDGTLIGMTYERDQQVVAWHRHPTQGQVESVTTIYGPHGDELWLVVKRGSRRFIERFDPQTLAANEANTNAVGLCYLDSSVSKIDETAFTVVDNLDHLEGSTVDTLADGSTHPTYTVDDGEITLQAAAENVCVGLRYESLAHLNSFEVPLSNGSSKSRKWRANRCALQYWQSRGADICANAADENLSWEPIGFRATYDPMDSPPTVATGISECALNSRFDEAPEIAIRQIQPLPLNVVGVVVKGDFYGD